MYIEWEFFISPIFGVLLSLLFALLEPIFVSTDTTFKHRFYYYGKVFIFISLLLTFLNKVMN